MNILKKHIFKIFILFSLMMILGSGCASTNYSKTYRQKQGLMILNNTEMEINKKYHSKEVKKAKRKSAKKYKKR